MITVEKQLELRDKLQKGLELTYERLLEFKKQKNSKLVIWKDNKVVKVPHFWMKNPSVCLWYYSNHLFQ